MSEDPRLAAARYRVDRLAQGETTNDGAAHAGPRDVAPPPPDDEPRPVTARDTAAYVETAIQQAIRRGDFDDLPGAGKPLPDLGRTHDPDWWIRRKIETEKLTGLGPPALTLRVESAELADRLDRLAREDDVRDAVEDFNRRVIDARRQLLGGPPVVTPTRDVDEELRAWHARRTERLANAAAGEEQRARRHRRLRLRGWSRG